MRVTRSVPRKKRKKKLLSLAEGMRGRKRICASLAIDAVSRRFRYKYRDRRKLKRDMRSLWIQRINAAARALGTTYSRFMHEIKKENVVLNRKSLSEIAARDFDCFKEHFKGIALNSNKK